MGEKFIHQLSAMFTCRDGKAGVLSSQATRILYSNLTIRPVARKGYGSIAHEAKPNGLLIRGL